MIVLGISALYHDSAACLVKDGEIIAAAQQERFSRIKHDMELPKDAIKFCLEEAGISAEEIDVVAFYDNSMLTLDRFIQNVLAAGEDSKDLIDLSFDSIFSDKVWIHKRLKDLLWPEEGQGGKIVILQHHISHAASAFYPSPYEEAVILTMDGVGEWATTTIGVGRGKDIELLEEIRYPHSLGLYYSAFTYYCGFKVNSGDYKFMGLAPYGNPIYVDLIKEHIIDIKEDGSFRLNLEYFDYQYGRAMINSRFEELFGAPRRQAESVITQHEMDIAASAQAVIEEVILKMVKHAKELQPNIENLVLAGGVALNCVANGKIKNSGLFKNMWIQPAAGDAGGSLGSALYAYYHYSGEERKPNVHDSQKGSYLGPAYTINEIEYFLKESGYPYQKFDGETLYKLLAKELSAGKVIGLFQGRMEFGPRALGGRSIIGDARSEEMQIKMNQKIKFRESFRPFAPSVLREDVSEYFELEDDSSYMLLVERVKESRREFVDIQSELSKHNGNMLEVVKQKRSDIPAVTHVDYSARIQTVTEEKNEYYYNLLQAFKKETGYGVIVNTSFNVRGEPIVCSLEDAYTCFMRTDMDVLVLESAVLYKEKQPKWEETIDWKDKFELD